MTAEKCTKLSRSDLVETLNGEGGFGSSVTVSATNSILVSAPINWNSSGTLTLTASGASGVITVNSVISNTGLLGGLKLNAKTIGFNGLLTLGSGSLDVNQDGAAAGSRFTLGSAGEGAHRASNINIQATTVEINGAVRATNAFSITNASSVAIAGQVTAATISVAANSGAGTISVTAPMITNGGALNLEAGTSITISASELSAGNPELLGEATLTAPRISFGANLTQYGNLSATATTSIKFATDAGGTIIFEGGGTKALIAPEIIWGAQAELGNGDLRLQTPKLTWLASGSYSGGAGSQLIIGGVDKTTITSPENISLTARNITINNELAWSGFGLSLNPAFTAGGGYVTVY
jgi:hypothetical protein